MVENYTRRPVYCVKHGTAVLMITNDIVRAFALYRRYYNEYTAPFLTIQKD